jgi:coatomer protein complex subunit alpha (xenin)
MRKDFNSLVHNSLFTMEVEDRVRLLAAVGQAPLAYLVAKTHGLTDDCARIQQMLGVWHAECRAM